MRIQPITFLKVLRGYTLTTYEIMTISIMDPEKACQGDNIPVTHKLSTPLVLRVICGWPFKYPVCVCGGGGVFLFLPKRSGGTEW